MVKVESRRFSSYRFSKPSFNEYEYSIYKDWKKIKKFFRVTVPAVEKRGLVGDYYVIKIQLPFP
jgi:hypothetical protein